MARGSFGLASRTALMRARAGTVIWPSAARLRASASIATMLGSLSVISIALRKARISVSLSLTAPAACASKSHASTFCGVCSVELIAFCNAAAASFWLLFAPALAAAISALRPAIGWSGLWGLPRKR